MFRNVELINPSATAPPIASPAERAQANWTDRRVFPLLMAALLLLYGLLQNPYWVPAGDSELYTAAARSMALGRGYQFNGQPIAIIPPGWSWMMSLVMRVTPYFLPLKLMAMGCVIGSLACAYWIVRRFVSPLRAAAIILLTAVLSHMYQATYWLISEGAFCLASTAALVVAMQIAEGRKQSWRVALLLALCAAAIMIRWAGVFGMLLVVAALLDGQWKPRLRTNWVAAALVVIVTLGTFVLLRHALRGTPEQTAAAADMVTGTGEDIGAIPAVDAGPPITGSANQSAKAYQLFPTGSYADRFLNFGRWFSYLYWQPFRAASPAAANVLGWLIIALLAVQVVVSVLKRRWLWLATAGYGGVLALGWTNVNARYYVPIAFLITLGIFLATDHLTAWTRNRRAWRVTVQVLFVLFIASVVTCNVALYAVEMAIARSSRFYQRYETGLNAQLIGACQHLNGLPDPPKDGQVVVSQFYQNLGRVRASPFGLRASVLLTGKTILTPTRFKEAQVAPTSNNTNARNLRKWLRARGAAYYLYQPPISPWRVWHYRMGWLEERRTGQKPGKDAAGWQLYRVVDDDLVLVPLPRKCEPVTRVPGL